VGDRAQATSPPTSEGIRYLGCRMVAGFVIQAAGGIWLLVAINSSFAWAFVLPLAVWAVGFALGAIPILQGRVGSASLARLMTGFVVLLIAGRVVAIFGQAGVIGEPSRAVEALVGVVFIGLPLVATFLGISQLSRSGGPR
jgi:hypothetical protein